MENRIRVINTRSEEMGWATQVNEAAWNVKFDSGKDRDVSTQTFNRWYKEVKEEGHTVVGPDQLEELFGPIDTSAATEEEPVTAESVVEEAVEKVAEAIEQAEGIDAPTEEQHQIAEVVALDDIRKAVQQQEQELMDQAKSDQENAGQGQPDPSLADQPEPVKSPFVGELLHGSVENTAKSKKVVCKISTVGSEHMHITEYGGYITDVRVRGVDGEGKEVDLYKSPKMSVQDVLTNHYKLDGDALKAAKKQITDIRKQLKANA